MTKNISAVVIGASGYTGAELIRLLYQHPKVEIVGLVADSNAGKPAQELYAHFDGMLLPELVTLDGIVWDDVDVAFCCLPHTVSQSVIPDLPEHLKIIDLAADFRLHDVALYNDWYVDEHKAPELLQEVVYGLTEHAADAVKKNRIVSCPGCYPTSILLPLLPLVNAKAIDTASIIIDAKSGISGAGRGAKVANLFTEVNENIKPYGIGGHRHVAEIEENLGAAAGEGVTVSFTPHVIPVNRGILSNIYVKAEKNPKEVLQKAYKHQPFVYVCPDDRVPTIKDVAGTNMCKINVFEDRVKGQYIIISVIDNLIKGASGQAVQNLNLMCGFEETEGLQALPVFP